MKILREKGVEKLKSGRERVLRRMAGIYEQCEASGLNEDEDDAPMIILMNKKNGIDNSQEK